MDQKMAQRYVKGKLMMAKEFKTNIVIGNAVEVFKSIYKDDYYTIHTEKEIKEFIEKWSIPHSKPLVFEDLSLMSSQVQKYLLKFIEEPPAPLIILASKDNISSIILSRCCNIVKLEYDTTLINKKGLKEFLEYKEVYLKEQEKKLLSHRQNEIIPFDTLSESCQLCPDYFYYINHPAIIRECSEEYKDACLINFEYGGFSIGDSK